MLLRQVARATIKLTCRNPQSAAGWSLLEMLCVLMVMTIAAGLWAPSWQQALDQLTLQRQQQLLMQQLRQAKAWAQQQGQAVTLVGWSLGTGDEHADIVSFIDTNGDRQWQHGETLLARYQYALAIGFTRGEFVRFSPMGTTGQSGSWYLCHWHLITGWKLVLSSSGNLRAQQQACHE